MYLSELTLWWEVVHILSPQTNRDMREMKERYIERIMGGRVPETRYFITCIDPCITLSVVYISLSELNSYLK
jgi:hypothetical protein